MFKKYLSVVLAIVMMLFLSSCSATSLQKVLNDKIDNILDLLDEVNALEQRVQELEEQNDQLTYNNQELNDQLSYYTYQRFMLVIFYQPIIEDVDDGEQDPAYSPPNKSIIINYSLINLAGVSQDIAITGNWSPKIEGASYLIPPDLGPLYLTLLPGEALTGSFVLDDYINLDLLGSGNYVLTYESSFYVGFNTPQQESILVKSNAIYVNVIV